MITDDMKVVNNTESSRFELPLDGQLAALDYQLYPGGIALTHTEVPSQWQNRGLGGKLAQTALDYARDEGLKVRPLCSFVAHYIREHPEYKDLVQKK
jgi:predicted GNAT family acetyltransferase